MEFKPRQKQTSSDFNVVINERTIPQVNETVFFGVVLDDNLTWKSHISSLADKISKSIGIIFRSSFYLSTPSLRMLYNAMILPYLNYCNLVWGSTYKTNLQRIVILQKRVIRIVNKSYYNAHTEPIFKKLNLLKFQGIHLMHLGQFMFSFKNAILPRKFENIFTINNQIHCYNTRHANSFRLPLCRTNIDPAILCILSRSQILQFSFISNLGLFITGTFLKKNLKHILLITINNVITVYSQI